jgi:hypothetical protein
LDESINQSINLSPVLSDCDEQEILGVPLGGIPTLLALPLGVWSLIKTLRIIFTGGVGKNGSTVAVSALNTETPNKQLFPHIIIKFSPPVGGGMDTHLI